MKRFMAEIWKLSPRSKKIVKVPIDVVKASGLEEPGASAVQGSAEKMTAGAVSGADAEDNGALGTAVVMLEQGEPQSTARCR